MEGFQAGLFRFAGGVTGRGDKDLAAAEMKLHKEGRDGLERGCV